MEEDTSQISELSKPRRIPLMKPFSNTVYGSHEQESSSSAKEVNGIDQLLPKNDCTDAAACTSDGTILCLTSTNQGHAKGLSNDQEQQQDENSKVKATRRSKGRVSFGDISFRMYDRTVGVHPAVSSGPALDFSWNYTVVDDVTVDEYEASNGQKRNRREMIVPKYERWDILMNNFGVTRAEIAFNVRVINRTKERRLQTVNNIRFACIEEKIQKVNRGIKRMLLLRKPYHREVKELWTKANPAGLCSSLSSTISTTRSSKRSSLRGTNTLRERSGSIEFKFETLPMLCCSRGDETIEVSLDQGQHRIEFDLIGKTLSSAENNRQDFLQKEDECGDTLTTYTNDLDNISCAMESHDISTTSICNKCSKANFDRITAEDLSITMQTFKILEEEDDDLDVKDQYRGSNHIICL